MTFTRRKHTGDTHTHTNIHIYKPHARVTTFVCARETNLGPLGDVLFDRRFKVVLKLGVAVRLDFDELALQRRQLIGLLSPAVNSGSDSRSVPRRAHARRRRVRPKT